MSKFKLGQEIIAIENHPQGWFKKGDEFIVDGFNCCNKCGAPSVYLKGLVTVNKILDNLVQY